MTGLLLQLPAVSWVVAGSRQFRESYPVPPISTCYGFLLSFIGEGARSTVVGEYREGSRTRHLGVRIGCGVLMDEDGNAPQKVVQFRQRSKMKVNDPRSPMNMNPDNQEVYGDVQVIIWLDSSDETEHPTLEERIKVALTNPETVTRSGPLCLGESCWLVNAVRLLDLDLLKKRGANMFVPDALTGSHALSLPVWADHKNDGRTIYSHGQLVLETSPPNANQLVTVRNK